MYHKKVYVIVDIINNIWKQNIINNVEIKYCGNKKHHVWLVEQDGYFLQARKVGVQAQI